MPDDHTNPWPAPSGPPAGPSVDETRTVDEARAGDRAPARRWATIGGLGAGLLGGVTAGLVFGVPGLSGAADAPALTGAVPAQTDDQPVPSDDAGAAGADDATDEWSELEEARREVAAGRIRENLQPLVDDGTLEAQQADAVAEHLAAEVGDRHVRPGMHGPIGRDVIELDGDHGGRGDRIAERMKVGVERMDELADALGLERDDLVDRLLDGESIADVATAEGVDLQDLVDVLVADRLAALDRAVAEGRIDEATAVDRKAAIEELATAHLEGDHPAGPRGRWERHTDDDDGAVDRPPDGSADGTDGSSDG